MNIGDFAPLPEVKTRDAQPHEVSANPDDIKIYFRNGVSRFYSLEQVKRLSHFSKFYSTVPSPQEGAMNGRELDLSLCSFTSDLFSRVLDVVLKNGLVKSSFAKKGEDHQLYECFSELLVNFHNPESAWRILNDIKDNELPFMTLDEAKEIVNQYSPETLNNQSLNLPSIVNYAKGVILRSKFFASEQEAKEHFESINLYQRQIQINKKKIELLEQVQATTRDKTKALAIWKQMTILKNVNAENQKQLDKIRELSDPNKTTMMMRFNLSKHVNDPLFGPVAVATKKHVDDYIETVSAALINGGADFLRRDLLDYLIGPKAFLFDTYGMIVRAGGEEAYQFSHPILDQYASPWVYYLENEGPMALENEIREDLTNKGIDISHIDPVIKSRQTTQQVDHQREEFKSTLYQAFGRWMSTTDEEVNRVKERILSFNGLDRLGISPAHIKVNFQLPHARGSLYKIHLNVRGDNYILHMRLYDCKLRLPGKTPEETLEFIRRDVLNLSGPSYAPSYNYCPPGTR